MNLKSKSVLFCGEITDQSKTIIKLLLQQNIKSILIANATGDSLESLGLADSRLSHYCGDLTKIEDLEVIYVEALKRTKKKVHVVVNHKEINANDAWEDVITVHINSLICCTLMAIKHLGSMNAGRGGTVLNSIAIVGKLDDEYASIYRLLNDLDRSFSDPYYFNNTAVRILTMCARMEIGRRSSEQPGSSNEVPAVASNVSAEADAVENADPVGDGVSTMHEKLAEMFQNLFANKRSCLDKPQSKQPFIEEFDICVRN